MDAFLLVEGNNDFHVISALCQRHNVSETFEILPPKASGMGAGGVEKLLANFRLRLRSSAGDTRAIGIVLDADNSPDGRWRQVTTEIKNNDSLCIRMTYEKQGIVLPPVYNWLCW